MATTTIRVDTETHAALVALGERRGRSLMDTVRDAAEALRRAEFAQVVQQELAALAEDEAAWADYLADAEGSAVRDGLG